MSWQQKVPSGVKSFFKVVILKRSRNKFSGRSVRDAREAQGEGEVVSDVTTPLFDSGETFNQLSILDAVGVIVLMPVTFPFAVVTTRDRVRGGGKSSNLAVVNGESDSVHVMVNMVNSRGGETFIIFSVPSVVFLVDFLKRMIF